MSKAISWLTLQNKTGIEWAMREDGMVFSREWLRNSSGQLRAKWKPCPQNSYLNGMAAVLIKLTDERANVYFSEVNQRVYNVVYEPNLRLP